MRTKIITKKDKIKITVEANFETAGKILKAIIKIADEEMLARKGTTDERSG